MKDLPSPGAADVIKIDFLSVVDKENLKAVRSHRKASTICELGSRKLIK